MSQPPEHETPPDVDSSEPTPAEPVASATSDGGLTEEERRQAISLLLGWASRLGKTIFRDWQKVGLILALLASFGQVIVRDILPDVMPIIGDSLGITAEDLPFPTRSEYQAVIRQQCVLLANDCDFRTALGLPEDPACEGLDCDVYLHPVPDAP